MSSVVTEPEVHPVPRAKAPWTLKAESYLLFLKLSELPQGVYDPLEEAWADKGLGTFVGGLGAVMIVRYSDTPVGPYDELILIPGNFTVPQPSSTGVPKIPKKALRISRIYVSQRTTTYNGRLNWNIPKHLARFSFSAPPTLKGQAPPASLDVKVFPPGTKEGDGAPPFFACTLTPWRWVPSIPVNTKWVPISMGHVQPPVPEPAGHKAAVQAAISAPPIDTFDINPKREEELCVGTDRWTAFDIDAKVPRARGCWVEVLETGKKGADESGYGTMNGNEREGEGRWFPKGLKTWSFGGWMEDGVLDITDPLEWKLYLVDIASSMAATFKMIRSALPYDFCWTSKLIRRDIRDLKSKYVGKIKQRFTTRLIESYAPTYPEVEFDAVIAEPIVIQHVERHSDDSTSTAVNTESRQEDSVGVRSSAATSISTKYSDNADIVSQQETLYKLLESKLKESYASRDRNMSHEDRWRFRGSWLLLHMAIQACPSNDCYNIFRDKNDVPDESQLLLELLQLSHTHSSSAHTNTISKMPTEPYAKHMKDNGRYDSAISAVSLGPTPQQPKMQATVSSPVHIWHAILEAATDASKNVSVAEDILGTVWPEKDAAELIYQVGHPSKQLREDESAELREKFRMALFPEYKTLVDCD
ncbi:hypothetical protein BKA66DRAFT_567310 [Pyrenochaeta sp. MPI-SDFR-AT-0127]|nr:hypothetical protein BKA66DRAFT_567310 [Pyrenochaeta sp. MPI-SDFR-AT-0127]